MRLSWWDLGETLSDVLVSSVRCRVFLRLLSMLAGVDTETAGCYFIQCFEWLSSVLLIAVFRTAYGMTPPGQKVVGRSWQRVRCGQTSLTRGLPDPCPPHKVLIPLKYGRITSLQPLRLRPQGVLQWYLLSNRLIYM